jgi:hypothetical protein
MAEPSLSECYREITDANPPPSYWWPSPHRTLERQLRDAGKTIMLLEERVQALEERDVAREDRVEKMAEFLNKQRGKQT